MSRTDETSKLQLIDPRTPRHHPEATPEDAGREMRFLDEALNVYRNNHGCTTPVEEFITNLILVYNAGRGIVTPDYVLQELDDFRKNFDDMIRDARHLIKQYPGLLETSELV